MNIDWAQHLLLDELLLKGSASPSGTGNKNKGIRNFKKAPWQCSPEMFGAILGDPWEAGLR